MFVLLWITCLGEDLLYPVLLRTIAKRSNAEKKYANDAGAINVDKNDRDQPRVCGTTDHAHNGAVEWNLVSSQTKVTVRFESPGWVNLDWVKLGSSYGQAISVWADAKVRVICTATSGVMVRFGGFAAACAHKYWAGPKCVCKPSEALKGSFNFKVSGFANEFAVPKLVGGGSPSVKKDVTLIVSAAVDMVVLLGFAPWDALNEATWFTRVVEQAKGASEQPVPASPSNSSVATIPNSPNRTTAAQHQQAPQPALLVTSSGRKRKPSRNTELRKKAKPVPSYVDHHRVVNSIDSALDLPETDPWMLSSIQVIRSDLAQFLSMLPCGYEHVPAVQDMRDMRAYRTVHSLDREVSQHRQTTSRGSGSWQTRWQVQLVNENKL